MVTVLVDEKTKDTILVEFESIFYLKYENSIIYKAILTLASLHPNFSCILTSNYNSYVVIY